jgi:hypothetical protein
MAEGELGAQGRCQWGGKWWRPSWAGCGGMEEGSRGLGQVSVGQEVVADVAGVRRDEWRRGSRGRGQAGVGREVVTAVVGKVRRDG